MTSSKSSAVERWADWLCVDDVDTKRYEVPGRGATKAGLHSQPPDRSIPPTSVLPKRFLARRYYQACLKDRIKRTLILIPCLYAHCSSSRGRGSPVYSTSSRVVSIDNNLESWRDARRWFPRNVAN